MSLEDKKYRYLSDQSYWLDKSRTDVDYRPKEDEKYYFDKEDKSLGQFKVLAVEDNTANGMQAMAVAPVVNGVVDYDNITIAYAGTNFGEREVRNENMAKMASRRTS